MDQSRSRPRHDADAEARPLIIERPDLAHPLRRVLAFVLTLAAWALLLAMWYPILALLAGAPLAAPVSPMGPRAGDARMLALASLVELFPVAIGLVVAILLANGLVGVIYRRLRPPPPKRVIGMEQLATGMALDPDKLRAWQSARILHVEHGALGRVVDARPIR